MKKLELIDAVAKESGSTAAEVSRIVNALIDVTVRTVAKKGEIQITGFGTFKGMARAARKGKNPRTGEILKIAATTVPKFVPGQTFRTAVAGKKATKK